MLQLAANHESLILLSWTLGQIKAIKYEILTHFIH